ncbi:hypothetical protein BLAT2472_30684 [Burkholderia latens]
MATCARRGRRAERASLLAAAVETRHYTTSGGVRQLSGRCVELAVRSVASLVALGITYRF